MRKALILLAAIALIILIAGAVNHSVAFDVDYVAGTVQAVSLFWVSVVVAGIVFVVGAAAAWLAQLATVATRRKLEAELQSTYERLREAEALEARAAASKPEPAPVTAVVAPAAAAATTVIEAEAAATIVEAAETAVVDEAATAVAGEAVTVVAGGGVTAGENDATGSDEEGAAGSDEDGAAAVEEDASAGGTEEAAAPVQNDEQTAVTRPLRAETTPDAKPTEADSAVAGATEVAEEAAADDEGAKKKTGDTA